MLQFRPKNFAKPEVKVEQTVAHATASSGPSDEPKLPSEKERKGKHASSSGRRRKQVRDEVVFGGGVGGRLRVVELDLLYLKSCFPCQYILPKLMRCSRFSDA